MKMITNKFYSGIGSRETPEAIMEEMASVAFVLEKKGYTLRSGNAEGADQAFASGVDEAAQIWLPWPSFNKDFQEKHVKHTYKTVWEKDEEAFASVDKFHPAPENLSKGARTLMARNYRQIAGKTLPHSEFVICWTKDGGYNGGTAQAIKIAESFGIPVYNMFHYPTSEEVLEKVFAVNKLPQNQFVNTDEFFSTLNFHDKDNKVIGTFDFTKSPAIFVGDVDASAQIFIDTILQKVNAQSFSEEFRKFSYVGDDPEASVIHNTQLAKSLREKYEIPNLA